MWVFIDVQISCRYDVEIKDRFILILRNQPNFSYEHLLFLLKNDAIDDMQCASCTKMQEQYARHSIGISYI